MYLAESINGFQTAIFVLNTKLLQRAKQKPNCIASEKSQIIPRGRGPVTYFVRFMTRQGLNKSMLACMHA